MVMKQHRPVVDDGGEVAGGVKLPMTEGSHHPNKEFYTTYGRRWYVVGLFAFFELHQCLVWNVFGPIAFTVKAAYGWSDGTLAMMLNWGCIMFLFCLVPLTRYLEKNGLRKTTILVAGLLTVGTSLRTLATDDATFFLLAHAGGILIGAAGVTLGAAPPVVSATWFPENERIFATSLTTGANVVGSGISYYLGPKYIPFQHNQSGNVVNKNVTKEEMKLVIQEYLTMLAVVAWVGMAIVIVYFPARPPSPPGPINKLVTDQSRSQWKDALSSSQLWLVCLSLAVPGGMQYVWQNLLSINFGPLGVSDAEIGHIGFITICGQAVTASVVAFIQDRFRDRIRVTVCALLVASGCCYIWLTLLCVGSVAFTLRQLTCASVLGPTFTYATVPLLYEYAVMVATPVSEELVGAFLSASINFVTGVLLLVFFIPDIGTTWMNYGLTVTTFLAVPLIWSTKPPPSRTLQPQKIATAEVFSKIA